MERCIAARRESMLDAIRFIVQGHGSPAPIPVAIDRGSELVAGTGLLPEFQAEYALRRMSKKSAPVKATGGGGYTFADKVAAGFLAQMLRRKFPLEPDLGPIAELHFETRDAGHVLDDLQLTLKRGMDETRCLVSVKSNRQLTKAGLTTNLSKTPGKSGRAVPAQSSILRRTFSASLSASLMNQRFRNGRNCRSRRGARRLIG